MQYASIIKENILHTTSHAPIFQEMPIVKVTFDDKKQKIQWVCEGLVCDGLHEYWPLCREQKYLGSKYLSLMNQMFGKQPGPLVEVLNGHALCKKNKLIRLESPPTVRNP